MRFSFSEKKSGFVFAGKESYDEAYSEGHKDGVYCHLNLDIVIDDVERAIREADYAGEVTGTLSVSGLEDELEISGGRYNFFKEDGYKVIDYLLPFNAKGEPFLLHGKKKISYENSTFELEEQLTTAYVDVYKGSEIDDKRLFCQGIVENSVANMIDIFSSIKIEGAASTEERDRAIESFFNFFLEGAAKDFFAKEKLYYKTEYKNLLFSGNCQYDGFVKHFFLASGSYGDGFPWGEAQGLTDLSIIIGESANDDLERFVFSSNESEDEVKIEFDGDKGSLKFKGKMFPVEKKRKGEFVYQLSYSDDLVRGKKSPLLGKGVDAEVELEFNLAKGEGPVEMPFGLTEALEEPFLIYIRNLLKGSTKEWSSLGLSLVPRAAKISAAKIKLGRKRVELEQGTICGEVESGNMSYVTNPKLFLKYICALDEETESALVRLEQERLYSNENDYQSDLFDFGIRRISEPQARGEIRVKEGSVKLDRDGDTLGKSDENFLLEVNYDHFASGIFQRRVAKKVVDGRTVWALEHDAKKFNLNRIEAEDPVVTNSPLDLEESLVCVHKSEQEWPKNWQNPWQDRPGLWDNFLSLFNLNKQRIKDAVPTDERIKREQEDKIDLLHQVIRDTGFLRKLEDRMNELGKNKENFKIVIKPNYMFLYNKRDTTTYVDPILIKELVKVIYEEGYRNVTIVEARSSYGNYFENREVLKVLKYIDADLEAMRRYPGLENFEELRAVDLTADEQIEPNPAFEGPLKGTKAPRTWAEADYRISFAKNKTHNFSYYTLTIKCIYGALPEEDKFKHYHCDRGIYGTTIEYIKHFPLDFGFIDAYISADGLAGVFSDKTPNYTRTIIGGENIVAVSWIGASKMGLNPMKSNFMKLAVKQFGKPRINLIGNAGVTEIYHPWVNSNCLVVGMGNAVDRKELWGLSNIIMSGIFNADEKAFPLKNRSWWLKAMRFMTKPMRDMTYVQDTDNLDELMTTAFGENVSLHSERENS